MSEKKQNITSLYSENISKLAKLIYPIFKQVNAISEPMNNALQNALSPMEDTLKSISDNVKKMTVALQPIIESISEARKNPNSKISWYEYYKVLSKCFWVFPYGITLDELKHLTTKEISESEFDSYMDKHFTDDLLLKLKDETIQDLSDNQITLYSQSVTALLNKSYSLSSLGFITIIDDLTSFFLYNKGQNKRVGLFEPLVERIEALDINEIKIKHFILMMVNENISTLYKDYPFDNDIKIGTNKDVNRQTSMHGKYYSNKRISCLMLVNTIYYLNFVIKNFNQYEKTIVWDKPQKKFIFRKQ